MICPVRVYVARAVPVKNAANQVVEHYEQARAYEASVYPVDNTAFVNEYGMAPGEMLQLIMAPFDRVELRDGVWIHEKYKSGDERPPWRVTRVMRWPRHTEVTVEKAVYMDG